MADDGSGREEDEVGAGAAAAEASTRGHGEVGRREAGNRLQDLSRTLAAAATVDAHSDLDLLGDSRHCPVGHLVVVAAAAAAGSGGGEHTDVT